MQYTSRIIFDNKMQLMEPFIYYDVQPIENWETKELLYIEPLKYETVTDWHPISAGERWYASFDHTQLFKTEFILPDTYAGKNAVLLLDLGGEGLVRINGEIISGIVSYRDGSRLSRQQRSRVYIPEKYKAGDILSIEAECCLNFLDHSYSVLATPVIAEGSDCLFRSASIALIDKELEDYWFDVSCAIGAMDTFANPLDTLAASNARILDHTVYTVMNKLNRESGLHDKLYHVISDSLSKLDLEFGKDRLLASVPEASRVLKEGLAALPHKAHFMVRMVGHAHIDTAWLWPLKESVRKCGKTFSNVVALMEKYPEFIFACSQPQLFAYAEEFYPELFEKMQQRVAEGRIELIGNAWVEMDTNVPSGESLVRQLLYGRQYYLDKFHKSSKVFWMPDVFGYSWAMPQIMKRSGVDYFFTSKLGNNDTNNFPHSLFQWQGVDGTRILSFLQPLGYNGDITPGLISDVQDNFRQKDVCDVSFVSVGYGDGGGGPNYQMLERAKRLKDLPGVPAAEFATAESFFQEAEKVQDKLPVWNDEMYYEFHRGTYSSQSETKKNNRKGELLLRRTEMACTFASVLLGREYPAKKLGDLWKKILTNQFHDILPGSSIHQVYEDCDLIYAETFKEAETLYADAIAALNQSIGIGREQIAVWNFLSWTTEGTVTAEINGRFTALMDAEGNTVNAIVTQVNDSTVFIFEAKDIPPMGVKVYTAVNTNTGIRTNTLSANRMVMENAYLRVALDENGNISSMYDKKAEREVFTENSLSNLLTIFEDIPHRESAWNIDLEYQNRCWPLEKAERVELVEANDVRTVVRVVRTFHLSTITQDIVLGHDARRVDFVTHVDWQEKQRMLKTAFYADVLSSKATYEIQFGAIERPTHWNTSYDKARFEVCGHKWADLSEGGYGVSILNDCKYGYDIKDNCLRLTLLRGTVYPDPTGDIGEHDFTYSIYPHEGDWRSGATVREAYNLNVPLLASGGTSDVGTNADYSFACVTNKNVVLDTIKGAEDGDGIIVRVYESNGSRGKVSIDFGFAIKDAAECNLMEENESTVPVLDNSLSFTIKPFEIKTFRVHKA